MATWRAKCWLGSANGFQELEVQSNTFHGADEQLRRIYGAEQIINLRKVNGTSDSSSSDSSALFPLAIILLLIWLVIEYWYISIPILVILVILFLIGCNDD